MKKIKRLPVFVTLFLIAILNIHLSFGQEHGQDKEGKIPQVIRFDLRSDTYQELLSGEKDSVAFYSGLVTIAPHESGELHSTEEYEEMIIVLEGTGEVKVEKRKSLNIRNGVVAYIPPQSEHQVFNTGEVPLKYIYIATKSKER